MILSRIRSLWRKPAFGTAFTCEIDFKSATVNLKAFILEISSLKIPQKYMAAEFKHIMLMVKDIPKSLKFYSEGLGLPVKMSSPGWAELDANGTTIALHAAGSDAESGSSPILSFHVEDIQSAIATLEQLGASLEGRVREPSFGKVAAIRTPDGHLVSLLQPVAKSADS